MIKSIADGILSKTIDSAHAMIKTSMKGYNIVLGKLKYSLFLWVQMDRKRTTWRYFIGIF